ncbi:MAG: TonB C-terminal domain-containing protein [bacterium]
MNQKPAEDQGLKTIAGIFAAVVNGSIFTMMAMAGVVEARAERDEPVAWVDVKPVELPKLGQERPKELPRIIEAPEPPPVETDTASISRKKLEEELERKKEDEKKQRELAEKKRRDEEKRLEDEQRRKEREEEAERKKREQAMARALRKVHDERADEDDPRGFADGDAMGTSTDPNSRLHKATYMNRVVHALREQFTVPSVIPRDVRKKLNAVVAFRIDDDGKLKGDPRITRSSNNRIFDDAVLATLRKFGPGSNARIPVPPPTLPDLRKSVLKNGLTIEMRGDD